MADYLPTSIKNLNTLLGEQLLDGGGGGGGSWTVLTEETVTTVANPERPEEGAFAVLSYSSQIDAETIKVTFNGSTYECQRIESPMVTGAYMYGNTDMSFSDYPFMISSNELYGNALVTEAAGTYTIKIEAPQSGGSSDFSIKQLTIINGDADVISIDGIISYENNLTMYSYDDTFTPVTVNKALYVFNSDPFYPNGIAPNESLVVNVLTCDNKVFIGQLSTDFEVVNAVGCTMEELYPIDDYASKSTTLVTFTSDSASITIRYKL